jgi:S-(hydroxymethyl)glutathione dehydrogenase/alcohol dehydrogenase
VSRNEDYIQALEADRAGLLGRNSTKTANVQQGDTVAVFGLGAVGLAVVQGAVVRKASRIIAIDTNDGKESWAKKMGATDFVNPTKLDKDQSIVEKLVEMTDGGLDFTL